MILDKSSLGGVLIAVVGILAGLLLEGGKLSQIIQPTAALIVFGGTIGAVMLQFPLSIVLASFKRLGRVFFDSQRDPQELVKEIVGFAHKARKEGIVSLDRELENVKEPFLFRLKSSRESAPMRPCGCLETATWTVRCILQAAQ